MIDNTNTTRDDVKMLNQIRKTTEMGQYGIDSVMDYTDDEALIAELESQYKEYDKICDQADHMLKERGTEGKHVGSMAKMASDMATTMNMMKDPSESKIAEMMIKGNNMGVVKNTRELHEYENLNDGVRGLAENLIATEESNVETMKKFL